MTLSLNSLEPKCLWHFSQRTGAKRRPNIECCGILTASVLLCALFLINDVRGFAFINKTHHRRRHINVVG